MNEENINQNPMDSQPPLPPLSNGSQSMQTSGKVNPFYKVADILIIIFSSLSILGGVIFLILGLGITSTGSGIASGAGIDAGTGTLSALIVIVFILAIGLSVLTLTFSIRNLVKKKYNKGIQITLLVLFAIMAVSLLISWDVITLGFLIIVPIVVLLSIGLAKEKNYQNYQ